MNVLNIMGNFRLFWCIGCGKKNNNEILFYNRYICVSFTDLSLSKMYFFLIISKNHIEKSSWNSNIVVNMHFVCASMLLNNECIVRMNLCNNIFPASVD